MSLFKKLGFIKCPFGHGAKLKEGLPPLTERLAALPIDERGYPIPFFVAYVDGKPEFRAADADKWRACVDHSLCWVCGHRLGAHKVFVLGPMCAVTRTTAEPPVHLDCAQWSVKGCPFLSKPKMVRRDADYVKTLATQPSAGIAIERNPGVMAIWVTKSFHQFNDGRGGRLIKVGEPEQVSFWREGRPATREEVEESVNSGLPLLTDGCPAHQLEREKKGIAAALEVARKFFPAGGSA